MQFDFNQPHATEGILFDNIRVSLDPRSLEVGGSWQEINRAGIPTAWDMETIKFFYERTLDIENPVILDIGANTGSFCLLAGINPSIKCLAFEPMPMIYEILKNNILLNNLQENVKPFQIALSDEKGPAVLKYPNSGTDSGFACLGKPIRFDDWTEIDVSLNTLDQVAIEQNIKKVDLIKIDTEGCEILVLKGGENLIREYHPGILTEYYEANTQQFGYSAERIRELLSSWGYNSKKISSEDMYFYKPKAKLFPMMNPETSVSDIITKGEEAFHEWITIIASFQNRLYYCDQTPKSLNELVKLVKKYKPTRIVELGTLAGLSLRTWLSADTTAEIVAIDLSFDALRKSKQILSLDLSRVKLLERNILEVDLSQLWEDEDRVLLYVDAHDQKNVPIMEHVLSNAFPSLPSGSVVVVDDLWYSPEKLTSENIGSFFEKSVLNQIDPLQCFKGNFAPYWKGGSFFGFPEVIPLMNWINRNGISLLIHRGNKSVAIEKDSANHHNSKNNNQSSGQSGGYHYNPLAVSLSQDEKYPANTDEATGLYEKGVNQFESGSYVLAVNSFKIAAEINPRQPAIYYALGLIFARFGQFEKAKSHLLKELELPIPHPNAEQLLNDIRFWEETNRKRELDISRRKTQRFTIFAVPKPFQGITAIIQKNAIKSWKLLDSKPIIILFGNEGGVKEIAEEFDIEHIPDVEQNEFGTPLVDSIFKHAQRISESDVVVYVNSDIILFNDFERSLSRVIDRFSNFLMIGQRIDLDVETEINFSSSGWENHLRELAESKGRLHEPTGIDYFAFTKDVYDHIPPFAIGRTMWDNWLVHAALQKKIPVINATAAAAIIHQNHSYGHIEGGKDEAWGGKEAQINLNLGGGYENVRTIEHATWQLDNDKFFCLDNSACNDIMLNERRASNNDYSAFGNSGKTMLRLLQVNTFYSDYIRTLYLKNKSWMDKPFDEQTSLILEDGFSAIHNFVPEIDNFGYNSGFIIANNPISQKQWLIENNKTLEFPQNWIFETLRLQIEAFKPDVLLLSDAFLFDSKFIKTLSQRPRMVIGWAGEYIPPETDWSEFDLILSNLARTGQRALAKGTRAFEYFYPGFVKSLAERVVDQKPEYDVVFVGSWSGLHTERNNLLADVARESVHEGKFSLGLFLLGDPQVMPAEVQACLRGERFGVDMHRAIKSGRIGLNAETTAEAGNMRMFETTGTGVLLLTPERANITDYFVPGQEIDTFRDSKELIDKIYYYLDHPEERELIAGRGMKRSLKEHSMERRLADLDRIIKKYLPSIESPDDTLKFSQPVNALAEETTEVLDAAPGLENIKALASRKRFGNFIIKYHSLRIHCHDLLSLYMAAKDIFLQRIYHFDTPSDRPIIIDGGGHIGLFTLYAKQQYPGAQITVFEPDPLSLTYLRQNIAANNLDGIQIVEAGLYKENGEVSFNSDQSDGSSMYSAEGNNAIKTVRLSDYLSSEVDFLKLNIEGAELDVISEIAPKLHLIKEMAIEYHGFPDTGQNLHRILNFLDRAGFRYLIHDFDGSTNPATKPPFQLDSSSRFFLLIYARKIFEAVNTVDVPHDMAPPAYSTEPVSRQFGLDRGMPIDRYYIEKYLEQHKVHIHGRVLEIGDNNYTHRFGTHVTRSDVLNVEPAPGTTIVGDLATGENIPHEAFDCIILTQSIQMIYDLKTAIKNAVKALKIGGALFISASGISQISRYDMDRWGEYWRFTDKSLKLLLAEYLPEANIDVQAFGNVASAKAFLDGMAHHELPGDVLDYNDNDYQVVLVARAYKTKPVRVVQPAAARTSSRPHSFDAPLILLYHRVAHDPLDAQLLCVSPENFDAHLRALADNYRVVSLTDLLGELRKNQYSPDTVALTFDDGYLDNYSNALPLLEKHRLPATVFVTSGMVDSDQEFWWDAIERIFLATPLLPDRLEFEHPNPSLSWDLNSPVDRLRAHDEIGSMLRRLPVPAINQIVSGLLAWAGLSPIARPSHRIVGAQQLKQLAASPYIEIGSHTVTHSKMSVLPAGQQKQEIVESKAALEKILNQNITLFSYPYGTADSFTAETIQQIEQSGFEAAIANIQGNISSPVNLYAVPRRLVRNWDGSRFADWLGDARKDALEAETLSARPGNLIQYQKSCWPAHPVKLTQEIND